MTASAPEISYLACGCPETCRRILTALPDWFGRPEALAAYVHHAARLPMVTASLAGQVVGFASLSAAETCEIHVMGVLPSMHRQGVGRTLVKGASGWALNRGYNALSVKTLSEQTPDKNYADTRAFYAAQGFRIVEELPGLWGPSTHAVLMKRALAANPTLAEGALP